MKACFIVLCGLLLTACAASGPRIEASRLNELRVGQTTAAEVIRQFGRPSVLSRNPDGTQSALYLHADTESGTIVVPLFSSAGVDSVMFSFDTGGVLTGYKVSQAGAVAQAPGQTAQGSQGQSGERAPGSTGKTATGSAPRWSLPNLLVPSATKENR